MPSIFSSNGATAARDRLDSCTLPPLSCIHLAPPSPMSRVFLSLFYCLTCFFLSHSSSTLVSHSSPPPPHPPSFSRAQSSQSRFASYFQKPLKASHFRIFHSRAAHRLCHSPGHERTSLLADTHCSPAHTHTHTHTFFELHVRPEPATADSVST